MYRGPVREPQDVVAAVAQSLRGLDSGVQLDTRPAAVPTVRATPRGAGSRGISQIGALDEHGLTTEPPYDLCDLDAGQASAEHDEAAGNRLHGRRFAGAPYADQAIEPRNGWHESVRARRYDDMLRRVASAVHVDDAGLASGHARTSAMPRSAAISPVPHPNSRTPCSPASPAPPARSPRRWRRRRGRPGPPPPDARGTWTGCTPSRSTRRRPAPARRRRPGAHAPRWLRRSARRAHRRPARSRRNRSYGKLLAALFAHHVLGVPVGPVRVGPADALLVLSRGPTRRGAMPQPGHRQS